ncbi:MAG: hypothetical protein L0H41_16180 [Microlunatus sp.]|nr:hypothetical protein [Microlunatus sp.]MDN5771247.1 hypothetical protein [Microlunatus sp.]
MPHQRQSTLFVWILDRAPDADWSNVDWNKGSRRTPERPQIRGLVE